MTDRGKEAMKRLGANVRDCQRCDKPINLQTECVWFLTLLEDGEVCFDEDNELFCSEFCAQSTGEDLMASESGLSIIVSPEAPPER